MPHHFLIGAIATAENGKNTQNTNQTIDLLGNSWYHAIDFQEGGRTMTMHGNYNMVCMCMCGCVKQPCLRCVCRA